jgi:hypothetical protein
VLRDTLRTVDIPCLLSPFCDNRIICLTIFIVVSFPAILIRIFNLPQSKLKINRKVSLGWSTSAGMAYVDDQYAVLALLTTLKEPIVTGI